MRNVMTRKIEVCCVNSQCGKTFHAQRTTRKFCSNGCRQQYRREINQKWYAENDPKYYQNYRTKQLQIRPWRYVFQSRRLAARGEGLPFELTDEWAKARWTGCCEITGLAFLKNPNGRGPWPFSCTIDKIAPTLGYTQDNSRFILSGCNALKGVGSDEDMYKIASAITATRLRSGAQHAAALLSLPT